ncbi:hypothetical protein GCM10009623_38980 [Nocardioides aestuarii]|uniref:Integral membrane protein n=1 Tax=Nocardioides aestuarii TaxID=252231 RepID=A0ABW4TSX6_9ACTN
MAEEEQLDKGELEAVLETRRELGPTYDAALIDSFADRIEATVEARVAAELEVRRHADRAQASAGPRQLVLGIVSAGVSIPITAISLSAGEGGGLVAMIVSWAGLVGINVAHAAQSRSGR